MELLGLSILLASLLFTFTLLKLVKTSEPCKTRTSNVQQPPPGPWKLPVIGNLHQLAFSGLPHRQLRALSNKYGPLMLLQLGEVPTIVVSSPEVAKEVMKTHDLVFASRPHSVATQIMTYNNSDIVFSPYCDSWKQLKKICVSHLLSAKRVQSFRSVREEEVSGLVHWISSNEGSVIKLTEKVFSLMYGMTARVAFGAKSRDQEAFAAVIEEIVNVISSFNIADMFPSIPMLQRLTGVRSRVQRLHQESDRVVENIINEHRQRKSAASSICKDDDGDEDLVDVLLKLQEHGDLDPPLSNDNIKAVIADIFGAGSETTATTVDWAMSEMMKNPTLIKKAQAEVREVFDRNGKVDESGINEMTYLKLVVKETLRLHPAAPLLIPRECSEICNINGFDVPLKANILVNAWAIGRDPEYWSDPESFIPERFLDQSVEYRGTNFEYIPFGAGRRICPGISFGVASMELLLAMLLYHFDWKLPNGMKPEDLDMTEASGVSVRRKQDLCMIPSRYHPFVTEA